MRHDPSLTRHDPDFLIRYASVLRAEAARRTHQPDFQAYLLEMSGNAVDDAMLDDLKRIMRKHNSIGRPAAFASWAEALPRTKVSGAIFWQAVRSEWSGFDRIDHPRFARLFRRFKSSRPASFVDHLPSEILIFRGQDYFDDIGLAWPTNPDVADNFSVGHRRIRHDDPIVYDITVQREDVAFCCDDRHESEIVLLRITKKWSAQQCATDERRAALGCCVVSFLRYPSRGGPSQMGDRGRGFVGGAPTPKTISKIRVRLSRFITSDP